MKPILIAMLLASALAYYTEDTAGRDAQRPAGRKVVAEAQNTSAAGRTTVAAAVAESPSRSIAAPAR